MSQSIRVRARPRFAVLAGLAAVSLALVPILGLATSAQAHNSRISSTPSPGQVLTELPSEFTLTTNGILSNITGNGSGFALLVTDSAGKYYGEGCVTVSGPGISTPAVLGAAGKYTLFWQVISTDDHIVSESFPFTWQPPAGFVPSVGSTKAPDCHGTQPINVAAKPGAPGTGASTVGTGVLSTVLWIGGAFLAIALAVIVTLVALGRKRKTPEDADPVA